MLLFHTFGGRVVLIEQTNVTATTKYEIEPDMLQLIRATLSNAVIAIIHVETDNLVKLLKYRGDWGTLDRFFSNGYNFLDI